MPTVADGPSSGQLPAESNASSRQGSATSGFDALTPETTSDGLPLYVPVERTDTLVRCQECGAVVEGDVTGQQQHNVWHRSLEQRLRKAWVPPRYGGR